MRKVILYYAQSVDGYIARMNGDVDWLDIDTDEDLGFHSMLDTVDTIVMGRNTYDQILGFGEWPYPGKECLVFTRRPMEPTENARPAEDPVGSTSALREKEGGDIWVVGGADIHAQLLEAGVIDEVTITIIHRHRSQLTAFIGNLSTSRRAAISPWNARAHRRSSASRALARAPCIEKQLSTSGQVAEKRLGSAGRKRCG